MKAAHAFFRRSVVGGRISDEAPDAKAWRFVSLFSLRAACGCGCFGATAEGVDVVATMLMALIGSLDLTLDDFGRFADCVCATSHETEKRSKRWAGGGRE